MAGYGRMQSIKGRFKALLSAMPVKVALNPDTALDGAARYAADRLIGLEV